MTPLAVTVPCLLALASLAGAQAPFRLVPSTPEPLPPATGPWLGYAAAADASKQRHVDLLLYFTAAW